jgi:hypothetical protein
MPSPDTVERFIACVQSNDHVRAIADFYTEDSSMQENQSPPRVGRSANKVMADSMSAYPTVIMLHQSS